MKLYEFMVKDVFRNLGIPVPQGFVVSKAQDIKENQGKVSFPVAIKSQVLTGGRGKSGGIKFADSETEAIAQAEQLLGSFIKDLPVEQVLVEQKLAIQEEYYFGIIIDRSARCPVVIASASGGVDIEEVARQTPEKVIRQNVNPLVGFREFDAHLLMKKIGLKGKKMLAGSRIMQGLYQVFSQHDAELTEINPLVFTQDQTFIATDGRLNIDDSSLYRHQEFGRQADKGYTPLEIRANKSGLSYVELDGNIGILGNGAGLVMATLDSVNLNGGKAANFCDLGGGSPRDRVIEGIDILLANPNVEGVFINILGGITRCDDVAAGLVEYRDKKGLKVPLVVRMVGTNEAKGKEICARAGIDLLPTMNEASKKIVALVGRGE